jgi:hypothetical protein
MPDIDESSRTDTQADQFVPTAASLNDALQQLTGRAPQRITPIEATRC